VLAPNVRADIAEGGFALVRGDRFRLIASEDAFGDLARDWDHLETDRYMADGGRYRLRRFGRFFYLPANSEILRLPHATVFQSRYVNGFAGGIHRSFAPLREATFVNPYLLRLIEMDFAVFEAPAPAMLHEPWEVWVHQIRITTPAEPVPPAPEGVHHDGHDFIAMHLMKRDNVAGGKNILYDNDGRPIFTCMLEAPMDTIYADDHRVMHAVDPVQPADGARPAERDMLIVDYDHRPGLARPG
jgi:hypothetical protein